MMMTFGHDTDDLRAYRCADREHIRHLGGAAGWSIPPYINPPKLITSTPSTEPPNRDPSPPFFNFICQKPMTYTPPFPLGPKNTTNHGNTPSGGFIDVGGVFLCKHLYKYILIILLYSQIVPPNPRIPSKAPGNSVQLKHISKKRFCVWLYDCLFGPCFFWRGVTKKRGKSFSTIDVNCYRNHCGSKAVETKPLL